MFDDDDIKDINPEETSGTPEITPSTEPSDDVAAAAEETTEEATDVAEEETQTNPNEPKLLLFNRFSLLLLKI